MSFEMMQSKVHWISDYPIAILLGYLIGKNIAKNARTKKTNGNETFRQKKYKRMKKFRFKPGVIYDPVTFEVIGRRAETTSPTIDIAGLELHRRDTAATGHFEEPDVTIKNRSTAIDEAFNYRISARINRHRSELVPVTLARRLLRTKRTLVLPAHVNLTVITNSYDVVHS